MNCIKHHTLLLLVLLMGSLACEFGRTAVAAESDPDLSAQLFTDRDLALGHARPIWWRLRRHEGVELPAERDVILIAGGRRG